MQKSIANSFLENIIVFGNKNSHQAIIVINSVQDNVYIHISILLNTRVHRSKLIVVKQLQDRLLMRVLNYLIQYCYQTERNKTKIYQKRHDLISI